MSKFLCTFVITHIRFFELFVRLQIVAYIVHNAISLFSELNRYFAFLQKPANCLSTLFSVHLPLDAVSLLTVDVIFCEPFCKLSLILS